MESHPQVARHFCFLVYAGVGCKSISGGLEKPGRLARSAVASNARCPLLELANDVDQLDFAVPYTSAQQGYAPTDADRPGTDMQSLFDAIVDAAPPVTGDRDALLRMLAAELGYDDYLGRDAARGKWLHTHGVSDAHSRPDRVECVLSPDHPGRRRET